MSSVSAKPTSADTALLESTEPRTGRVVARFSVASPADVGATIQKAAAAAEWWAALGHRERKRRLGVWRREIASRLGELVDLVTRETGKARADAELEAVLALDHLHWAGANAKRVLGRSLVAPGMLMSNHLATVTYRPLGVVGVIGPWNYPIFTPMGSIAYALAAGNAVVFKPSEQTPAVGQWLADTCAVAIPEMPVLQTVIGPGETGDALCRSGVSKIAFTGSPGTARTVMAACAESLTPLVVEGGGKDAVIVDHDADLLQAADAVVWGAMGNAGQTCVGVERVYVHTTVADELVALVRERAAALAVTEHENAEIGPITLPSQLDVIRRHIDAALSDGGRAVLGGAASVRPPYVDPTVLVDVPEHSCAVQEETFGPVVVINRVDSMEEAVRLANASKYALGATVFSRVHGTGIATRLRAGMVGVNSILPYAAMPSLPFGGVGESGFGRIHGADGLREFAQPQSVARKVLPPLLRPTSFDRPGYTMGALQRLARTLYGR